MDREELNSYIQQCMDLESGMKLAEICRPPVFSVIQASHKIWPVLSTQIPEHLLPVDVLKSQKKNPDEWSVVSIAFPRKKVFADLNAKCDDLAHREWFKSKLLLRKLMPAWGKDLGNLLNADGIETFTAPGENLFQLRSDESGPVAANWSERHVAYATGLGTFGLHGALITEAGSIHRLISFFIHSTFKEYNTPAATPFANCLFHQSGICKACIRRCPANAISTAGHKPLICRDHAYHKNGSRVREIYNLASEGCGLCLTGVPCSSRNPLS